MATYFFHLRDGHDVLLDPDGRELADHAAIVRVALMEARHIIGHEAIAGSIKLDQHIDVEDSAGVVVHTIAFADAVAIIGLPPR